MSCRLAEVPHYKAGREVCIVQFMSTTTDREIAKGFVLAAGREAVVHAQGKPYYMEAVRKAIQKWSGEAMKVKKADPEKVRLRCTEIMEAMISAGGGNLTHKEITGVFLGDVCKFCVEAENAYEIRKRLRSQLDDREESDRRTPSKNVERTPSIKSVTPRATLSPIIDPFAQITALIGKIGALSTSPAFHEVISAKRELGNSTQHQAVFKRFVKDSFGEKAFSLIMMAGPGPLNVHEVVGKIMSEEAAYLLLAAAAVDVIVWMGFKEGSKPNASCIQSGEEVIAHLKSQTMATKTIIDHEPFTAFKMAFPGASKASPSPSIQKPLLSL